MPSLRQIIYRLIYLNSPGWQITRLFRRRRSCQQCGETDILHLHHLSYPFFGVWYRLFLLAVVLWVFHEAGMWLVVALLVIPDFISPVKTLCARCHRLAHRKG